MEKSDNKQYLGYANGFLNFCHFFDRHFYVTLEETEITGSQEWTMKRYRQYWAQDTEQRQTKNNIENLNNQQHGSHQIFISTESR